MDLRWQRIFDAMNGMVVGRLPGVLVSIIAVSLTLTFAGYGQTYAMQKHTLLPEESAATVATREQPRHERRVAVPGEQGRGVPPLHASEEKAHVSAHPNVKANREEPARTLHPEAAVEARRKTITEERKAREPSTPAMVLPESEQAHEGTPGAAGEKEVLLPEHGKEEGGGEEVVLPQISSIPGVTFVETMINLMEYELKGRFLGWRPNDLILGRFTDNVNNYQLGVLEAMRFTTLRLKDSLTRMGEADSYDRDLEDALNLFMNKSTLFWFPSAESSYQEAVDHLKKFLVKLKTGQRSFYYRVDNLLSLINSYGDLLGNVDKTLAVQVNPDETPISFFETDDYFYYAKGVAHVMYEILKVVRVGFQAQLVTLDAVDIMDEILHELHTADSLEPWIVLNSDLDGFFANHRANLNAPLSEVAHLMGVLGRF